MKKFLFSVFSVSCFLFILPLWADERGFCLHGQITITQSDMPDAGDTLRVSFSNDTLDLSLTGANYTWNYSFLTPSAQWVRRYDAPNTFPFPFNLLFNPINTSYGEQQYTPDSIVQLQPDNAYFFFRETPATYRQVGSGLTINAIPIPFVYNPHDTIYHFPLQYGNKDSSFAKFGFQIPPPPSSGYYYGQSISRNNEVDGWGTLITPFGSFQALRVKSIVNIRDTFADTLGNGYAMQRPPRYEFHWLVQGGKVPYLLVTANNVNGNLIPVSIMYRDSMRNVFQIGTGENDMHDIGLYVFPNPASGFCFVEYSLSAKSEVKIELHDLYGRKIAEPLRATRHAGRHMELLQLSSYPLAEGLCFISVSAGSFRSVKKILKTER